MKTLASTLILLLLLSLNCSAADNSSTLDPSGNWLGVLNAGARLVGGCCGTTPAHIQALADMLSEKKY